MTTTMSPADVMRKLKIAQEGDPILAQETRPFVLPDEAEEARRLVAGLISFLDRVAQVHKFTKGIGLAAPQIKSDRSAAAVRTPDGYFFTLINPQIVGESAETDEQYEGCLSFFNVRGKVRRPLRIEVEHQSTDGARVTTSFERGMARLVCHEVDHLYGKLYKARMKADAEIIPISQYDGTGRQWHY
jgi:peptide deformylase